MAKGFKLDVLYGAATINPVLAARICPKPGWWDRKRDELYYWLVYWPAHRLRVWRQRRQGLTKGRD